MGLHIERKAEPRIRGRRLWAVAIAVALLVLGPALFAGGLGRAIADLWIAAMRVVAGLVGGLLGL